MTDTPRQPPTAQQLLRFLIQQMKPVSKLASSMEDPNQPQAIDTMIRLQEETVLAVDRIHERLERLESRLSQPPQRR